MSVFRQSSLWLGLGVTLLLTACVFFALSASRRVADYKQNPNPQQRYDITLTIADAPGPFASMEGLVQYDVTNQECLPPPSSNPGGYSSPLPTKDIPFSLTQVSENRYTGTIFADMMLDEDYYGRGVCHWRLVQARVRLKATGAKGDTLFIPNFSEELLRTEQTKILYFLKESYPRHPESTMDTPLAFGQTDRSKMPSSLMDEDLFTITLASRTEMP